MKLKEMKKKLYIIMKIAKIKLIFQIIQQEKGI